MLELLLDYLKRTLSKDIVLITKKNLTIGEWIENFFRLDGGDNKYMKKYFIRKDCGKFVWEYDTETGIMRMLNVPEWLTSGCKPFMFAKEYGGRWFKSLDKAIKVAQTQTNKHA